MTQPDYYSVLGLSKTASDDEIKKKYKKLAMKYHPDRKNGDEAMFQKIQEAYATIGDPVKRAEYDNPQPKFDGFRQGFNNGDPFSDFSNFGQQFRWNTQPTKNPTTRVSLSVTLESTLDKQDRTLSVLNRPGPNDSVNITIPRGVIDGQTIAYAGLGDHTDKSLPRGDIHVTIKVLKNANFEVNGKDIYTYADINCFQAMLGSSASITGLDKKVFSVKVPAGTQPLSKLRIKGQGLYDTHSLDRGDLYVVVNVKIPIDLTDEQKELVHLLIKEN